jgi:hypothetical protein
MLRLTTLAMLCLAEFLCRTWPAPGLIRGTLGLGLDMALGPSLAVIVLATDVLYAVSLYGPQALSRWLLRAATTLSVLWPAALSP